jgi:hypothetical protein
MRIVLGRSLVAAAFIVAVGFTTALPAHAAPAHARTTAHAAQSPDPQANAYPRIGCGGGNAVIRWVNDGLYSTITTWGEAWDTCGSGTYVQLFLSWDSPTHHNVLVATAGPNSTVGFNAPTYSIIANPGHIGLTACEHDNGWHCGATYPV